MGREKRHGIEEECYHEGCDWEEIEEYLEAQVIISTPIVCAFFLCFMI